MNSWDFFYFFRVDVTDPAGNARMMLEAVRDGRRVSKSARAAALRALARAEVARDKLAADPLYSSVKHRMEVAVAESALRAAVALRDELGLVAPPSRHRRGA